MGKLVYGVGVYEKGKYKCSIDGKTTREYLLWNNMLERCYSEEKQKKCPTYIGCSVDPRWHDFQTFAENINNMIGFNNKESSKYWCLDKDILKPNNKVYSKENCCFVPHSLNCFFTNNRSDKGDLPIGVSFNKISNNYKSTIRKYGDQISLGSYITINQAEQAYNQARISYAKELAIKYAGKVDPRVIGRLYMHTEKGLNLNMSDLMLEILQDTLKRLG